MHLSLPSTSLSVAVLGTLGSYHHQVAQVLFADAAVCYCTSFDDIVEAVCSGEVQKGIVAIANSTIGTLPAPQEALTRHAAHLTIEAYYTLPITHCLVVANPTVTEDDIQIVRSHHAALQQCRTYLAAKRWETQIASDTATAVKEIMLRQNAHLAAIASPFAARLYGAHVLPVSVQDQAGNATTFAVIRRR